MPLQPAAANIPHGRRGFASRPGKRRQFGRIQPLMTPRGAARGEGECPGHESRK